MIIETKLDGFKTKLKFTELDYPCCSCGNCPKFFYNLLSIASVKSGKTYSICQLIKHYESNKIVDKSGEEYPIRTILISPTIQTNRVFESFKSIDFDKDVYDNYTDDLLRDIVDDIDAVKKECNDFKLYKKAYKMFIKIPEDKIKDFYDKEPELFALLESKDFASPDDIQQPKYKNPPVNLIILDDILGGEALSQRGKSFLTYYYIKNRNKGICFMLLSQSLKAIPKNLRLNTSVYWLGNFQNRKMILDDLYPEVSNVLTTEQFEELYSHAVGVPFGALIVDNTHKEKRFLQGFDTLLEVEGGVGLKN